MISSAKLLDRNAELVQAERHRRAPAPGPAVIIISIACPCSPGNSCEPCGEKRKRERKKDNPGSHHQHTLSVYIPLRCGVQRIRVRSDAVKALGAVAKDVRRVYAVSHGVLSSGNSARGGGVVGRRSLQQREDDAEQHLDMSHIIKGAQVPIFFFPSTPS